MTRPPGSAGPPAESGLVVVDKPAGLTSHDVVGRIRRLAGTRRVGHAGTLDPMATGVLVLGVNKATRLLGHLALTEKAYDATVRLGSSTTTDDAEGEVLTTASVEGVTDSAVSEALAGFLGPLQQVPSAVSAIKVGGRRAHARVRDGEQVVLAARPVTVHELVATRFARHAEGIDVDLTVRCSSGTYVRAIARDLGAALGVGGHLTRLRRTAVGPVGLAEAHPLSELETQGVEVVPLREAVGRFFPTVTVGQDAARDVGHGRFLTLDLPVGGPVAVLGPDGEFLALYRRLDDPRGDARPVAVFL